MALIPDQLRIMAEGFADETAYKFVGVGEMTFAEWEEGANRVAHGLVDHGVGAQDRVALLFTGEDAARNLQAYMGVHKAGAVTVPVNNRLAPGEIRQILEHAEPHVLLVSQELEGLARDAVPPGIEHLVSTGDGGDGLAGWETFCSDDTTDLQVPITADDMADILYTSGTTGLPKGVVVRHRNGTQMEVGEPAAFTGLAYLHASPFFTFAGLSFLFVPMRLGFTGIYLPRFDAGTWLEVAEREPVAMTFVVPAMVELLESKRGSPEEEPISA
jgi:acyl-CoA synthetase (AMP-forming)/AMP-acid ligase II